MNYSQTTWDFVCLMKSWAISKVFLQFPVGCILTNFFDIWRVPQWRSHGLNLSSTESKLVDLTNISKPPPSPVFMQMSKIFINYTAFVHVRRLSKHGCVEVRVVGPLSTTLQSEKYPTICTTACAGEMLPQIMRRLPVQPV